MHARDVGTSQRDGGGVVSKAQLEVLAEQKGLDYDLMLADAAARVC